jgi:hypothetical protein
VGNRETIRMLRRQAAGTTADPAQEAAATTLRGSGDTRTGERISITDDLLSLLTGGSRMEPEMLSAHKATGTVTAIAGQKTVGGADPSDVKQGALGDCYLLAALAAVAKTNPALIERMISDNGDGTYNVTIYEDKGAGSQRTSSLRSSRSHRRSLPVQEGYRCTPRPAAAMPMARSCGSC